MLKLKQALSTSSFALCLVASALVADVAQAAPVTTLSDATAHPISGVNVHGTSATPESGMTYSSTSGSSLYGYTSTYGLASNGSWNGANGGYLGLNTSSGYMTITFDQAVSSFLAFVNYAPGYGLAYLSAYDLDNQLIESMNLTFSTPGGLNAGQTLGFAESANDIKSIRFGNAYIVASNLVTGQAVPLPNTALLMAIGFGTLAFAVRRRGPASPAASAVAAA